MKGVHSWLLLHIKLVLLSVMKHPSLFLFTYYSLVLSVIHRKMWASRSRSKSLRYGPVHQHITMRIANSVHGVTDLFYLNFQESGIGMRVGRNEPRDPLDVIQKSLLPLDGPQETSMSWTYFPCSPSRLKLKNSYLLLYEKIFFPKKISACYVMFWDLNGCFSLQETMELSI